MKKTNKQVVRASAISLLIILLALSLFSCGSEKKPMPPKEELAANLEAANAEASYTYVATYLGKWGFSYYYPAKLREVESLFKQVYVGELPSTFELAKSTAAYFVENLYDKTDLTDMTAVTTAIIDSYVKATGDKYAVYRRPQQYDDYHQDMSGEYCGIGVSIEYDRVLGTMRITSVTKDSPAEEAGFAIDDYIIAVNGVSIDELGYEGTAAAIKGEEGTTVDVTVKRGDEEITLTSQRRKLVDKTVYYKLLSDGIGYIEITTFKENTPELFREALDYMEENDAAGIIFDLRSNPGGYLSAVIEMLEYIAPAGHMITSYTYVGKTYEHKTENADALDVPCAIICNEATASAAELFTSTIRDWGEMGIVEEIIIGAQTYGKGIMQNTYRLGDNSTLSLTIAYYYTPLGENYQDIGITPDVVVEYLTSADEQLDAAFISILGMITQ